MSDTLVVIPTYNEIDNLRAITDRVLATTERADILVVDDDSPDGTGGLADRLAAQSPRIHVLHRSTKSGLGDAYRAGFAWGLARDYDVLVEMDGDGSHRPEELPALIDATVESDVVVGSRWVAGGEVQNWALRRELLSRGGSFYARLALGLPFRDITGGFRAYRASALVALGYASVRAQGYCFQIEMLWRAWGAGLSIRELPIRFDERLSGESKMEFGIITEALRRVTGWGVANLPHRFAAAVSGRKRPGPSSRRASRELASTGAGESA